MAVRSTEFTDPNLAELSQEQKYFDDAWLHREEMRTAAAAVPQAAANSGAAAHMRKHSQARLAQLGSSEEQVAFGRIDDDSGETLYIGRHTIFDDSSEVLVVNWQAPAAIPYFEASHEDPRGLQRRRSFECDGNTVKEFTDLIFAQLALAIESLDAPTPPSEISDALLQDLEKSRTGEMQDIVETIQAAQFQLIREEADQLLIIQGGPGTGKTAVALHRVSWLLYNERDWLTPEQVLVVGPNPTFTRYIRTVLPSLGDVNVEQRDIGKLAPAVQRGRFETDDVIKLKGDARMAGLLARALDQRIGVPSGPDVLTVQVNKRAVRIGSNELTEVVDRLRSVGDTYMKRRQVLRDQLVAIVRDRVVSDRGSVRQSHVDSLLDRLWPPLTAAAFLRDLLGSRDRLIAAAGDDFTAAEVARLQRRAADRLSEESWSSGDLPLLDEAETLINGLPARYGHIVVDEAQDLSPMQLRSIARRSSEGAMTIVGDIAQSTGPWARDSWDEVLEHLPADLPRQVHTLRYGYRVPRQAFEMAAKLLPIAAPDTDPPHVVRDGPTAPELHHVEIDGRSAKVVEVASRHAGKGRFVGIVCPDSCRTDVQKALDINGIKWSDGRDGQLGQSINLVSPAEAKGLEFDAVVVVEPEDIVDGDSRGYRMLYVALTRTTTYLDVVHVGGPLPLPPETATSDGADNSNALPTFQNEPTVETVDTEPTNPIVSVVSIEPTVEPHPPTNASIPTPREMPLSERIVQILAEETSGQIRDNCPERLWGPVLTRIAELLGQPAPPHQAGSK